jgi:hypothetical protein
MAKDGKEGKMLNGTIQKESGRFQPNGEVTFPWGTIPQGAEYSLSSQGLAFWAGQTVTLLVLPCA